jgi:hypothetical protein
MQKEKFNENKSKVCREIERSEADDEALQLKITAKVLKGITVIMAGARSDILTIWEVPGPPLLDNARREIGLALEALDEALQVTRRTAIKLDQSTAGGSVAIAAAIADQRKAVSATI